MIETDSHGESEGLALLKLDTLASAQGLEVILEVLLEHLIRLWCATTLKLFRALFNDLAIRCLLDEPLVL